MQKKAKNIWPYAIVTSILFIFFAAIATVVVALQKPVQMSNEMMQDYHHVDANANALINAEIAFNKRYRIDASFEPLHVGNNAIAYTITTTEQGAVEENISLELLLTRPDVLAYDQHFSSFTKEGNRYIFSDVNITIAGRWNAIAHVKIGQYERYYNLKLSTQYPEQFEY